MTAFDISITFILSIFDGICLNLLLNAYLCKRSFLGKKSGNAVVVMTIAVVWTVIVLFITRMVPREFQGVQSIFILVSGYLIASAYYSSSRLSFLPKTLIVSAQHVLLLLIELIEGIVYCGIKQITLNEAQSDPAAFLAAGIISRMVLFIIIILFFKKQERNPWIVGEKNNKHFWLVILCPAAIAFVSVYALLFAYHETNEMGRMLITVAALSLMFLNLVILYIFNEVVLYENELSIASLQVRQVDYQLQAVSSIVRMGQEHETLLHDEKNKVAVALALFQMGNVDDGILSLKAIVGEMSGVIREVYTTHPKTDIMLSIKNALAAEQNIQMSIKAEPFGYNGLPLKDDDLAVIMGNVLDNAIEAASKLPQDRTIKVSMESSDTDYLITVLNNTAQDIDTSGKLLPTTKIEKGLHGIGLRSVEQILSSYNGEYFLQSNLGWFQFTARVPF